MTNIDLGKVAITPKGDWQISEPYERLDVVTYKGSSYVARIDNIGKEPTEPSIVWQQIASKGDKGEAFVFEDFTAEQIAELQMPATEAATMANQAAERAEHAVEDVNSMIQKVEILDETVFQNEAIRASAELSRKQAEAARVSAEQKRESAETERKQSELNRETSEQGRASAESVRVTTEQERVSAEASRKQAENDREVAELQRETKESERESAESSREQAEQIRETSEQGRAEAESGRVTAESSRTSAEQQRVTEFATLKQNAETATTEAEQAAEKATEAAEGIESYKQTTDLLNELIEPKPKVEVKEMWKENAYRNSIGAISSVSSYQITKAEKIKRGDLIILKTKATQNVYVLSEVSSDNTFIQGLVLGLPNAEELLIRFVAPKDMYIEASGLKILFNLTIIPNSLADYSVPPAGGYNRGLYEAAGAVYNEKTGFYELNGLPDITEEQMAAIYEELNFNNYIFENRFPGNVKKASLLRTNIPSRSGHPAALMASGAWIIPRKWAYLCTNLTNLEKIKITTNTGYILLSADNYIGCTYAFYGNPKLKSIEGIIDISGRTSGTIEYLCSSCPLLESVKIYGLKCSIKIKESPLLSKESILYMVQNSAATSPITITLHADAYAMAMADAEIQTALAEKTNVSLASA